MEKIIISSKILDALGLSVSERLVFEILLGMQMGNTVARIAERSKVPRTTVVRILKRLEERRLVARTKWGARDHWKYKKGLEFYERRPSEMV